MTFKRILLACPEELGTLLSGYLHEKGFDTIDAFSYTVAIEMIQSQELSAVVLISDWAIKQEDGSPGLMEFLRYKIPTYSLITSSTYQKAEFYWPDDLYYGRKHEYQYLPANIDAIVVWLNEML